MSFKNKTKLDFIMVFQTLLGAPRLSLPFHIHTTTISYQK